MVADQIANGVGFSGIVDKVRKLRAMRLMLASPMSARAGPGSERQRSTSRPQSVVNTTTGVILSFG